MGSELKKYVLEKYKKSVKNQAVLEARLQGLSFITFQLWSFVVAIVKVEFGQNS